MASVVSGSRVYGPGLVRVPTSVEETFPPRGNAHVEWNHLTHSWTKDDHFDPTVKNDHFTHSWTKDDYFDPTVKHDHFTHSRTEDDHFEPKVKNDPFTRVWA